MNPRSVLHALPPIGRGTGEVESLLSYFCRLAASHSTSTLGLSRMVAERFEHAVERNFDWHERQLCGIRESALTWSSALSALTSVPHLDRLTFLPWKDVISQNGLPIVSKGQFCPHCLAEDRADGRTPYFRLAWESKSVTVCNKHGVRLSRRCPCCGQDNVRHAAALVVPGWCTKCGEFLGRTNLVQGAAEPIAPVELWKARQVSDLIAAQHRLEIFPQHQALVNALSHITNEMDGGISAHFARRVGISKSTVHHWLQSGGTPTLEMSLQIASQSGISLTELFTGDTSTWQPPSQGQQRALLPLQPEAKRRAPGREIDWDDVERQLQKFLQYPTPISVLEVARHLEVEARQLYLHSNQTTRRLGERWKAYLRLRRQSNLEAVMPQLESVGRQLLAEGRSVTHREVRSRMPSDVLSSVPQLFNVLRDVRSKIEIQQPSSI